MRRFVIRFLVLLLVPLFTELVEAEDNNSFTNIIVRVTVMKPPPCVINENKPIEVNFGTILIDDIDGKNNRIPVEYTLNCTTPSNNAMKLQIKGTGAGFDSTILQSSVTGLGIALDSSGSKIKINDWIVFNYPNKPNLWAVPVKDSSAILPTGVFTASATMFVEYQ